MNGPVTLTAAVRWAVPLALALVVMACGDDDTPSTTSGADPGVTFAEDVTVPTDPTGDVDVEAVDEADDLVLSNDELPAGWPGDFPLPADAEVELGAEATGEGERNLSVDLTVDRPPATVHAELVEAVEAGGGEVLRMDERGRGAAYVGALTFETDRYVGDVLTTADGSVASRVTLTATLPE